MNVFQDIEGARRALALALGASAARCGADPGNTAGQDHLLRMALTDLSRDRPRMLRGEISLIPGEGTYEAPADLARISVFDWGRDDTARQWDSQFAGPPPRVTNRHDGEDGWIEFAPAPTHRQVAAWGALFRYRYCASHQLDETGTTLAEGDRDLLILRATAEAMQGLAAAGVVQPIQTHRGMGASLPANGTPAALAEQLMHEYRERVRGH